MKARRNGVSVHKVTLPAEMTEAEYLVSVQYCARCGTEYDTHAAALMLEEDEELGEDDDAQPLAVCRNRMACDGNLIERAAEWIDHVRDNMVAGKPFTAKDYELLTNAWDDLRTVYGDGMLTLYDGPRCGECFGPLPEGAEDGSVCRFCREKAARDEG